MLSDELQALAERFESYAAWPGGVHFDPSGCAVLACQFREMEGAAMALERAGTGGDVPIVVVDGVRVVSLDSARERRANGGVA